MRRALCTLSALLFAFSATAQFTPSPADPGSVKWMEVQTDNYRVIYPSGMDSLARVYAFSLERHREPVSRTIGLFPNEFSKKRFPVILHPYTCVPNGIVTWTPKRMDLYTVPETVTPLSIPWVDQLATHESRHVAQMQGGENPRYKVFKILTGELFAGAYAGLYGGPAFLEGDAVSTETELSASGRGRRADFLEYYRVCFLSGEYRNFWQWMYGSLNKYSPNHYAFGYLALSGARTTLGIEDFPQAFYRRSAEKFLPVCNTRKLVRERTGLSLGAAFDRICRDKTAEWAADTLERGPFMPSARLSPVPELYLDYSDNCFIDNAVYELRSGIAQAPALVKTEMNGKVTDLCPFSGSVSALKPSENSGRIYWSEIIPDPRWPLKSYSEIRYTNSTLEKKRLTRHTRYFCPAVSPDETRICATELPESGGSALVILDAFSGKVLERIVAPDSLQLAECEWAGERLIASAVSPSGTGLYDVRDNFRCIVGPWSCSIGELWHHNGHFSFTSDRNGVNELHTLDLATNTVYRTSDTPFGASGFQFNNAEDTLLYSVPTPKGRLLYATPTKDLKFKPISRQYSWKTADRLSASAAGKKLPDSVFVSEPKRYAKAAHLIHYHSWLPFFLAVDSELSTSPETLRQAVGLGVTGYFQNELGTAYGYTAYHFEPRTRCIHSAIASITYTGLYPAMEAKLNLNNDVSSLDGKIYIPWNFSSGGWSRALIPQISGTYAFMLGRKGDGYSVNASIRGYSVLSTPASCYFPRFGIGGQLGYARNREIQETFGTLYCYLPGFYKTHGLKLSAKEEYLFGDGNVFSASAQYAIPFGSVDWAGLSPAFYVRNFELIPQVEYYNGQVHDKPRTENLSVGGVFDVVLGNLLFIPYPARIGLSYSHVFGNAVKTDVFGFVFTVEL